MIREISNTNKFNIENLKLTFNCAYISNQNIWIDDFSIEPTIIKLFKQHFCEESQEFFDILIINHYTYPFYYENFFSAKSIFIVKTINTFLKVWNRLYAGDILKISVNSETHDEYIIKCPNNNKKFPIFNLNII